MLKKHTFLPRILLLLFLSACTHSTPEQPGIDLNENHEITGVSVWDRISTRNQPVRNSPSNTLLSLGESFIYLDTFAIDSSYNNTKFLKARLSDSSIVWVYDFASELNSKPAVITNEVPLYLRPDLLTITDERINTMEIVAVVDEWNNWIRIVNEKKANRGWISKEFITYNTVDLAFALLVKRSMAEEDLEEKINNMEDLLEKNPYPNTIFISEFRKMVDQAQELLREGENNRDRENRDRRERD